MSLALIKFRQQNWKMIRSVVQCLPDYMLTLILGCKVNYYWLIVDLISRRRPLYYIVYSSTRQQNLHRCGYWRSQLITALVPEEEENPISPQIELSTHITGSKVFRHLFSGQSHFSVISGTPSSDYYNKQCYKLSIEVSIIEIKNTYVTITID